MSASALRVAWIWRASRTRCLIGCFGDGAQEESVLARTAGSGDKDGGFVTCQWARERVSRLCSVLKALLVVVDRTLANRVGLHLIAQSKLLCLVHVLLHVLKAWALLVHVAGIASRRRHSLVTSVFLPISPPQSSSESCLPRIELWMTDSVSLGSNPDVFEVGLQLSYLLSIFSGQLHEFDRAISIYQYTLPLLPRSAPLRAVGVYSLAVTRLGRYLLLKQQGQQDDLEQSILGFTV